MNLGLDCSTSVCGYTLLNDDGSFDSIGYLDFKKFDDLYDKTTFFTGLLVELQDKKIKQVYIEAPAMVYSSSTAQIISLLQRFNGMVSVCVYKTLAIKPILFSSHQLRKACDIKVSRGINTKMFLFEEIKKRNVIPENVWQYKRTGNPKDYCFDMCDSYITCLGGILLSKNS